MSLPQKTMADAGAHCGMANGFRNSGGALKSRILKTTQTYARVLAQDVAESSVECDPARCNRAGDRIQV